jgi:hypothetical protein
MDVEVIDDEQKYHTHMQHLDINGTHIKWTREPLSKNNIVQT